MAGPAAKADAQRDTEAVPAGPIELSAILAVGATFHGTSIRSVSLLLDDGRVFRRIELPTEAATPEGQLTPTQVRMVRVLAESPVPLTRKEVARRCNRKPSGKFTQQLNSLVEVPLERIFRRGDQYTDAAAKFASSD